MTLQELLNERGITSALVIDDGYDAVPRASDLDGAEIWSNFFADSKKDEQVLTESFPPYAESLSEDLQSSDQFVAALWNARGKIRASLWDPFFEVYLQSSATDRTFLDNLEQRLVARGITVVPSGRTPPDGAEAVNLIFIDLFLGAAQQDPDIKRSLDTLKPLLKGREKEPPCVVLMSRSELLRDKKEQFRDDGELLGSMFRVYSKMELLQDENLERTLERLVLHRPDAMRVARFVHGWKTGLSLATERFLGGIRRLDLPDYAQIRDVLLAFEGQPLGSYLLDVFDRVLAHEIEGDEATIEAAEDLNLIDPALYPAPHIAGSSDLQDLVFRTIWQNPKRLKVKSTMAEMPVGFGDVLVRKELLEGGAIPEGAAQAYVVMTPACDLVRESGAKRILLVSGKLSEMSAKSWTYGQTTFKTPIMCMPGEKRVWIGWDAKDLLTLTPSEIANLLSMGGTYRIHLRLREAHAIELQQRLLAEMGRIGLIAQMPATFPVKVSAYSHGPGGLRQLSLPITDREGGVCFVGRDKDSNEQTKLVLTEGAIDELLTAVGSIAVGDVHDRARDALARLQADKSLALVLQRGMPVPRSDQKTFATVKVIIPEEGGHASKEGVIGWLARNPSAITPSTKNGALVLVIQDLEVDRVQPGDEAAEDTVEKAEASDPAA